MFIRRLACVDDQLRPIRAGACTNFQLIPGDGWAHHPYSLSAPPDIPSRRRDDATIANLDKLTGLLGRLVQMRRLAPGLANVWLTEYGYETNPPVKTKPFSTADQARFLPWSEYLAWRNPHVLSYAQFLLRDINTQAAIAQGPTGRAFGSWQTGLFFEDGTPKPAAESFRVALWAQYARRGARSGHARGRRVLLWGHVRTATHPMLVRVEETSRARAAWTPVTGRQAVGSSATNAGAMTDSHGYFAVQVKFQRGVHYRLSALFGPWGWQAGPPITPQSVRS
jgi:hypothetical protein